MQESSCEEDSFDEALEKKKGEEKLEFLLREEKKIKYEIENPNFDEYYNSLFVKQDKIIKMIEEIINKQNQI